jgi:Flp pilus assembly protein TadB
LVEDSVDSDNSTRNHMSAISTFCPRCHRTLEIPYEFDNLICPGCATPYWIRRHGDLISLSEISPDSLDSRRGEEAAAVVESRLAEIDELIEESESEVESLRSREQSGPLQHGCAFFGLFMMVILVIALFMLIGRAYVGSWLFYLTIAVVIVLSLVRIRRKLATPEQFERLREERHQIEDDLTQLRSERARLQDLSTRLRQLDPNH